MKKFSQMAVLGALALAFAGSAMADGAGGGGGAKEGGPVSPDDHAASAVHHLHLKHHSKSKGTTLHQEDKASKLKGASAASAASAMGTNDKGQPQ